MIECPRCHRGFPESVLRPLRCSCGMVLDAEWVDAAELLIERGPGAELTTILSEVGIRKKDGCKCAAHAATMNRRGVHGCIDTKPEILGWLQEAYDESTLTERATAGLLAIAKGYPLTLAGLLDLAIERAKQSLYRRELD